jgi:hypothetical protein
LKNPSRQPHEVLYESEASLRLVDKAIEELSAAGSETEGLDIRAALARAMSLVERLDTATALPDAQRREAAASLRNELRDLSSSLHFQDITSQQLLHVTTLLDDARTRLSLGALRDRASRKTA